MARIRTLKPEFWKHEDLSALPEATHLLAAALLNYSDDFGYFNANPRLIQAECLPLREPSVSVPESLRSLQTINFIELGTGPTDRRYGRVVNFTEHQRVSHPTPSKIADLSIVWDIIKKPPENIGNSPDNFAPEQGTGNREQGKREAVAKSADPTPDLPSIPESLKRGTRLSLESLPDEWREFCQAERPDLDPERTWAIFQDHWRGKAGQAGVKLDWLATWRNWVRREGKGNGINRQADGGGGRATKDERGKAALLRGLDAKLPEPSH